MSAPTRPTGIVFICLYSIFFGLASIPVGCSVILAGGEPWAGMPSIFGAVVSAVGIFLLVAAYGLWKLQPWGRTYTQYLYVACIPLGLLVMFGAFPGYHPSAGNTVLQIVGIAVDIAVLGYLSEPSIEALYGGGRQPDPFDPFVRREPR
jgi:hypothetical protein